MMYLKLTLALRQLTYLGYSLKIVRMNLVKDKNYIKGLFVLSVLLLLTITATLAHSANTSNSKGTRGPIKVVIIDPGHGGKDSGAVGPSGLKEKNITLAIAKEMKRDLERNLDVKVLLTRKRDKYLTLTERTDIANEVRADLFISLHINASRKSRPDGVETYFLSFEATDDEARKLAALENGDGVLSRKNRNEMTSDLESILWDLTQTATHHESSILAESIQRSLGKMWRGEKRGVKQAPFRVLVGATMPAVLVEMGFISNPKEEELLKNKHTHRRLAYAVTNGVIDFEKLTRKSSKRKQLKMGKSK